MNLKKLFLMVLMLSGSIISLPLQAIDSDIESETDSEYDDGLLSDSDTDDNDENSASDLPHFYTNNCVHSFARSLHDISTKTGDQITLEKNCRDSNHVLSEDHTEATNTDLFTVYDIKPTDKRYPAPSTFPAATQTTYCKEIYRPRFYARWAKWFPLAEEKHRITYFHNGVTLKDKPNPHIVSSFLPSWQVVALGTAATILGTATYAWSVFKQK